jgi:hypothetical protein
MKDRKEGERNEPTLFDEINAYLRKEAPERVENPTIQGLAERSGIREGILNYWLVHDKQFQEELTRLRDFQINDPFREGTEFDYWIHSSGIQFVLDETKKRYTV